MKKILLIDDSPTIIKSLELMILSMVENVEILVADSYTQANNIIRRNSGSIYAAIVDLGLPDCTDGQAALLTSSHKIPTIIFTSSEDKELKELLVKKDILDYIQKGAPNSLRYAASFIKKIIRNYDTTALVVDDSKLSRKTFKDDLEKLHINVLEAEDGKEALDIVNATEEKISLVLTDYNMPNMDGIELTTKLRELYDKDTLAIVALSATEDSSALAEFMKAGANDFLAKPHRFEELNVRVQSNLDILELFQKTKDLANKDFLTGSYNRRYFFEVSEAIVDKNVRKNQDIAVATLDIDHFKNVNDTYGHDVGDVAIKEIVTVLDKSIRTSDLVARFGGEEYSILLEDISLEDTQALFEKIRQNFEKNVISMNEICLKYTVSIGVAYGKSKNIDDMLKISDEALYEAKESGRNRVVIHKSV